LKRRSSRLLAIESPFPDANVKLRLLEPPESCHETLRERLYSGSYDKPFVVDNGPRRFLHFDFGAIQSVMELSNPVRLALAYTRKMMAFLLFNRTPKRILLLGLGGGSLAKFCYANLPAASLTAIEVNQDVIALRDEFAVPTDDHRFRVINADGAAYLSTQTHLKDVILADACDRTGIAAELGSVEFYRKARSRLSARGVFVDLRLRDVRQIDDFAGKHHLFRQDGGFLSGHPLKIDRHRKGGQLELRHLAIENFLAEEDGITGDYGPNNFYIYRFLNTVEINHRFTTEQTVAIELSNTPGWIAEGYGPGPLYPVMCSPNGT